ncbi:unnamed protein product [Phaeothamnion confervicola]
MERRRRRTSADDRALADGVCRWERSSLWIFLFAVVLCLAMSPRPARGQVDGDVGMSRDKGGTLPSTKLRGRPAARRLSEPADDDGHVPGASWDDVVVEEATPARIAYTILVASEREATRLSYLLPLIYHPANFYLIHLDAKATPAAEASVRNTIGKLPRPAAAADAADADAVAAALSPPNVELLEPRIRVAWGGFSLVLAALHGLGRSLRWQGWDFWINLSASDMPLMTQPEMMAALGVHAASNASFIAGIVSSA